MILDRFPALRRLDPRAGARRVPVVHQLTATECGAACLTAVLGYHGKQVSLDEVRSVIGPGRDGASALALLEAGRAFGLRGRGVRLEPEALELLPAGTILHWGLNHFVVFAAVRRRGVEVVDPACGRRQITPEVFRRFFTGVALILEPGVGFERGRRPGSSAYARAVLGGSTLWARILAISALLQVLGLALPLVTSAVVDRIVPLGDRELWWVVALGLALAAIFQGAIGWVRSYLLLYSRTAIDARTTLDFLEHLVRLPHAFFQVRSSGDLLMRMNSNAMIRELLTSGILTAVLDGSLVVFNLALLFALAPAIGATALALGAGHLAILGVTRRRQRDLLAESLSAQARAQSYQMELLSGIETLKAAGAEQRAVERFGNLFVETLNASIARGRLAAAVDAWSGMIRFASPGVLLLAGASSGVSSAGALLALSSIGSAFLGPLANLAGAASQLQLLGAYLERMQDVLGAEPEEESAGAKRRVARLRGRITLERVSFQHSPAGAAVLEDLSIDIPAGAFVAIVGRSGSGKSTLARLLVGLHRPTSGRISFDGVEARALELTSLRKNIGVVTQEPQLFSGTVRSNIALSNPELSLEAIVEAAKRACVHPDIAAMPLAYETPVGDRGSALSGGQRQRIALARALVGSPAVLLLDEATSALDALAEAQIHRELGALRSTRIVIAHRLSTVIDADLILVLDGGRIVEAGAHAELVARRGVYARLISAQLAR